MDCRVACVRDAIPSSPSSSLRARLITRNKNVNLNNLIFYVMLFLCREEFKRKRMYSEINKTQKTPKTHPKNTQKTSKKRPKSNKL